MNVPDFIFLALRNTLLDSQKGTCTRCPSTDPVCLTYVPSGREPRITDLFILCHPCVDIFEKEVDQKRARELEALKERVGDIKEED